MVIRVSCANGAETMSRRRADSSPCSAPNRAFVPGRADDGISALRLSRGFRECGSIGAAMFSKVLIANRGEIACRVLRTCRRLGIRTVAIYSDADERAMHAALADEAVRVGPAPVKESYLQIDAVVAAAKQTGAEAVHPGYGLLSERSAFARAVAQAGIVFIGPPPEVLDALGDKMKARHVAKAAGVPSVPGLDHPLPTGESGALA